MDKKEQHIVEEGELKEKPKKKTIFGDPIIEFE